MAISIICTNKDPLPWYKALAALDPHLDVRIWPDDGDKTEIDFALTWRHPHGVLNQYPNLKVVSSMGAGIDHITQDVKFPAGLCVVRVFDTLLIQSMFAYIGLVIENFRLNMWRYQRQQQQLIWQQYPPFEKQDLPIGVMGLGQLGGQIAQQLTVNGFRVYGWSNSPKSLVQVNCFSGQKELPLFLSQCKVLINLLPLTAQTQGILNYQNLAQLQPQALLINVARGEHLVEKDLLVLLEQQKIAFACLDVFQQEPLSQQHAFWTHSNVQVTPHIASLTQPTSVAPQILDNYYRCQQGEPLLNQVDLSRGY